MNIEVLEQLVGPGWAHRITDRDYIYKCMKNPPLLEQLYRAGVPIHGNDLWHAIYVHESPALVWVILRAGFRLRRPGWLRLTKQPYLLAILLAHRANFQDLTGDQLTGLIGCTKSWCVLRRAGIPTSFLRKKGFSTEPIRVAERQMGMAMVGLQVILGRDLAGYLSQAL